MNRSRDHPPPAFAATEPLTRLAVSVLLMVSPVVDCTAAAKLRRRPWRIAGINRRIHRDAQGLESAQNPGCVFPVALQPLVARARRTKPQIDAVGSATGDDGDRNSARKAVEERWIRACCCAILGDGDGRCCRRHSCESPCSPLAVQARI